MSEIRRDPISGRLVIFATERSKRPAAFARESSGARSCASVPAYLEGCPFCAGNERMTPPELLALGRSTAEPDTAGWRVRVVPNRYPAVMLEEKERRISGEH